MMNKVEKRQLGGGVVLVKEDKILLGYQYRSYEEPCWGTPGGKVDEGETVTDSMIREVFEETGIKVNSLERLAFYEDLIDGVDIIGLQFYTKDFEGEPEVREKEKCREWKWFRLEDLPENLTESVKRLLKEGSLHRIVNK